MYTITFSLAVLANNFIVLRIRKDTQMMKDSPWACTYLISHQYRMILSRTMTISCTIYIAPVTSFLVSSLISWDSTKRKFRGSISVKTFTYLGIPRTVLASLFN